MKDFAYDGLRWLEKDYAWNRSGWVEMNEIHFIYVWNLVVQERNAENLPVVTYTRGLDLSGTLDGGGATFFL